MQSKTGRVRNKPGLIEPVLLILLLGGRSWAMELQRKWEKALGSRYPVSKDYINGAIHRLEEQGLIQRSGKQYRNAGFKSQYYILTENGQEAARECLSALSVLVGEGFQSVLFP